MLITLPVGSRYYRTEPSGANGDTVITVKTMCALAIYNEDKPYEGMPEDNPPMVLVEDGTWIAMDTWNIVTTPRY